MARIIVLLILLMNTLSHGNCINKVSVLKYKGGNECSSALIGVPIKSTSSTSLHNEFTFCGKYFFRFLKEKVILMSMEPDVILGMWIFEKKVGIVLYGGVFHRFYFQNQTVVPDSWQYICLAVSLTEIKIVLNGEILPIDTKADLPHEDIKETKLWIGGALFSDWLSNTRFEGMIAKANLWNIMLENDTLISITTNGKPAISSAKYDLLSMTISKNSSCIDHLILDESDELFQDMQQDKILLTDIETDFDSSKYLCQGYGGNLPLPKDIEEVNTLALLIKQSCVCKWVYLGLTKSNNEEILDLKGNIVSNLKWGANQPNGGETQKCIVTSSHSFLYDIECSMKNCFACLIPEKSMFILRGSLTVDAERKYFVTMNSRYTEIRGLTDTECFWNERKWNFGMNLKLDNATINMPPVGLQNWNNGMKLKFTQCTQHEFTCHTYGHCIPMNQRCDGHPDCLDASDENKCKIMTLDKGYDNRYPSQKNITCFISVLIYNIIDIDELHMLYRIDFRIKLKWLDSRIVFRNLKPMHYENKLEDSEIGKIWTPKLYLRNSLNDYVEAGQKSNFPGGGIFGNVEIYREGSLQHNELSELDEDYLYPGHENPISMVNDIAIKLGCKFDLKWYNFKPFVDRKLYPFDTQKCPLEVETPRNYYNQFVLKWSDPPIIQDIQLNQYNVHKHLQYANDTLPKIIIGVEITLCRKLSYHIVSIYLPTICLIMIAGFTLFIDFSHFEVSIMIALTSMLVTYTLYQSVSAYLPSTSYMKMIDIWLFGGLIFPFFIITILVIMDFLVTNEKNQVDDIKNEGRMLKSTMFMKLMQVMLLVIGSTLIIIYWVVGLYHHYSACPI